MNPIRNAVKRFYLFAIWTFIAVVTTTNASAAGQEDRLIKKIVEAYGGVNITGLKSLTINNKYKSLAVGRSANPDVIDINLNNSIVKIDFENKRSSVESWSKTNNGVRLGRNFNNGHSGHSINFMRGTHVDRSDYTYYKVARQSMRMLDTTLVKILLEERDTAQYRGDVFYRGTTHHKLSFAMPESSELTLFIDQQTGLISKMTQPGELSYVYSEYRTQDGITYASDSNFLVSGQPNRISLSRSIKVNPKFSGAFKIPKGIVTIPGGMLDASKMKVEKVADDVYLAGQGRGFSIFVDAGDYFIATSASPGLTKRFAAVKKFTGTSKPLKYYVVAHHHTNRIGADEAEELGANFVTVKDHLQSVRNDLSKEVEQERFILVEGKMSLANGRVQVIDIGTSFSEHFLLFYMPEAKLVFGSGHFSTKVKNALPGPSYHAVSYLSALDSLNLDIERLYDANTPRMFTIDDLRSVAAKYTDRNCLSGHIVCADNLPNQ